MANLAKVRHKIRRYNASLRSPAGPAREPSLHEQLPRQMVAAAAPVSIPCLPSDPCDPGSPLTSRVQRRRGGAFQASPTNSYDRDSEMGPRRRSGHTVTSAPGGGDSSAPAARHRRTTSKLARPG